MTAHGRPLTELIDLSGRVAIVTGAAQGLGFEVSRRLAEAGAAVVVNDLDGDRAREAADLLGGCGQAEPLPLPRRRVQSPTGRRGRSGDGALCLRTGRHSGQQRGHLADDPVPRVRRGAVDEDARGQPDRPSSCARSSSPGGSWSRARAGRSSTSPRSPLRVPHPDGLVAYGASKAGVVNATRTLAKSLAPSGIGSTPSCRVAWRRRA